MWKIQWIYNWNDTIWLLFYTLCIQWHILYTYFLQFQRSSYTTIVCGCVCVKWIYCLCFHRISIIAQTRPNSKLSVPSENVYVYVFVCISWKCVNSKDERNLNPNVIIQLLWNSFGRCEQMYVQRKNCGIFNFHLIL